MIDPTHPTPEDQPATPIGEPDGIPQPAAPDTADPAADGAIVPDPGGTPPPVPEAAEPEAEPESGPHREPLYRNPVVIAAGALAAGVVLSRVLATPAARRLARDVSAEILTRFGAGSGTAGRSPWDELAERIRPAVTDYAKKMLADLLGKKE